MAVHPELNEGTVNTIGSRNRYGVVLTVEAHAETHQCSCGICSAGSRQIAQRQYPQRHVELGVRRQDLPAIDEQQVSRSGYRRRRCCWYWGRCRCWKRRCCRRGYRRSGRRGRGCRCRGWRRRCCRHRQPGRRRREGRSRSCRGRFDGRGRQCRRRGGSANQFSRGDGGWRWPGRKLDYRGSAGGGTGRDGEQPQGVRGDVHSEPGQVEGYKGFFPSLLRIVVPLNHQTVGVAVC